MLFSSNIQIILSKNNDFEENKIVNLNFDNEIGEGSYGIVYKLNNNYAIKVFKNCTLGNIDLSFNEKELLPKNNENRELLFYFELLKKNIKNYELSINHILQPIAIGFIKNEINYYSKNNSLKKIENNSYFIILPLCIPFYKLLPIKNNELIDINSINNLFNNFDLSKNKNQNDLHKNKIPFGINFVLNVMKRLSIASIYLEDEFKIYNLDFKISNIMFLKPKSNKNVLYEDLIVIDFGLIKHISDLNSIFNYDHLINQKYFIWPYSGTSLITQIPSYSISIIGLELLFGKKEVEKLPSYRLIKKIIEKLKIVDNNLFLIFSHGIIYKTDTKNLLNYIKNYLEN
jgi:hypothetical protein